MLVELGIMLTGAGILVAIIAIVWTSGATRRIIQESAANTQKIIEQSAANTQKIIEQSAANTQKIMEKIAHAIYDIDHTLKKVDFGLTANAAMHGWARKNGVESEEEASKLGKPYLYNKELKICFFRIG
jgi:hypothetical protein